MRPFLNIFFLIFFLIISQNCRKAVCDIIIPAYFKFNIIDDSTGIDIFKNDYIIDSLIIYDENDSVANFKKYYKSKDDLHYVELYIFNNEAVNKLLCRNFYLYLDKTDVDTLRICVNYEYSEGSKRRKKNSSDCPGYSIKYFEVLYNDSIQFLYSNGDIIDLETQLIKKY